MSAICLGVALWTVVVAGWLMRREGRCTWRRAASGHTTNEEEAMIQFREQMELDVVDRAGQGAGAK